MSKELATGLVFLGYMVGVFLLAILSHKIFAKKSFMAEYFLGSRSLGVWAFAFTFAATSASGGSFTGYPSLIYTHGWILALWIGSYMVVPIVTMGMMGRRLNQVGRRAGAITIPDVVRERFASPGLGLFATATIIFFTITNLIAQFKAGGVILDVLLQGTPGYNTVIIPWFKGLLQHFPYITAEPGYVIGLIVFAFTVVIYTSYGGFRAVVWTDVMQGVIMGFGVLLLIPVALRAAGGLENVTRKLNVEPPMLFLGLKRDDNAMEFRAKNGAGPHVFLHQTVNDSLFRPRDVSDWTVFCSQLQQQPDAPPSPGRRLWETFGEPAKQAAAKLAAGEEATTELLQPVLDDLNAALNDRSLGRVEYFENVHASDEAKALLTAPFVRFTPWQVRRLNRLLLEATYPDLIAKSNVNELKVSVSDYVSAELENARLIQIQLVPDERGNPATTALEVKEAVEKDAVVGELLDVQIPEVPELDAKMQPIPDGPINNGTGAAPTTSEPTYMAAGSEMVFGPGRTKTGAPFHPLPMAISFFVMWAISGAGQPGTMVRLMAFKDSKTLRRAIFTVTIYFGLIYLPMVFIFVAARNIIHPAELASGSDQIMPVLAMKVAPWWMAGILIAAPYAAVMSTVDSFLLMISSSLVRDIYQRTINPAVSERSTKIASYTTTTVVGVLVTVLAFNPPEFLQYIIVFTGGGFAATFLAPTLLGLYWKGITRLGAWASMVFGFFSMVLLSAWGHIANFFGSSYSNAQIDVLGFHPIVVGLIVSFASAILVSLVTPALPEPLIRRFFAPPDQMHE